MYSISKSSTTLFGLATLGLLAVLLQNLLLQKWPFTSHFNNVEEPFVCEAPQYTSRVVSYDPLIIHVENFILPQEREYLINHGKPNLKRSLVANRQGGPPVASEVRTSSTAFMPWNDTVATCLQHRAAEFQGFLPRHKIEAVQVVQYQKSQEYRAHFDWGVKSAYKSERDTTFFGILQADCKHCGTQFPEIAIDWSRENPKWCDFVECEDTEMLTFKAIEGSAVFWRNLDEAGRGDRRVLHAGLPVKNGTKIGLNIWTIV